MTEYGPTAIWAVIVLIAAATYGFRLSFLYALGEAESSELRGERFLRLVPSAVLAALAVPAIVTIQPTVFETLTDERLLAGIVATAVAWRTEDMFATIAAGMLTLWAFRFVVF